ncbi:50S ribosomal protein L19 [Pyxidicoccus trucidator]|uniref:50S ribosomal protein L19 n=1 Tax=Pyxidicoccus trucidator TaxID=2709662 RepID=UPI0013DB5AC3|nr:50S ribosomal protein L19 [Pyxidicoccus trucidator]
MRNAAIQHVEAKFLRQDVTAFRPGDSVRVHWKVKEGDKERVQAFEGVVIRLSGRAHRATFAVRKMSFGVGVERIFPLHSPRYERIEVLSRGAVNRSRLFYLRDLKGKAARVDVQEEPTAKTVAAAAAKKAAKSAS